MTAKNFKLVHFNPLKQKGREKSEGGTEKHEQLLREMTYFTMSEGSQAMPARPSGTGVL
jgi:hypothetical protein